MSENANAQAATGPKPITPKTRFFYGFGDWAFSTMSNVETFFFNYFLTNVANFSGPVTTTIATVTSTVDAALSWIYGAILNATKPGRFGRYRTWLVMVPWVVPFLYTFQFLKIGDGPTAYVLVTLGFIVSHVVWNLPWSANVALISVAGGTPEGRAALSSSRATWNQFAGITFAYIGPPLATFFGAKIGASYGYAALAFSLGILMVFGYFVNFAATSGYEVIETGASATRKQSKTKASIGDMAKSLISNPSLCVLIFATIPALGIRFIPPAVAAYYFQYVAGGGELNRALLSQYMLIVSLGAFAGAFLSGFIAKKFSSRNTLIGTYAIGAVALFLLYFNYSNVTLVIFLMALTQIGQGICYSIYPALFADCAVYSKWKLGVDARGWIMGLATVPLKVAIIGRSIIVNISLMAVGFNAIAIRENPSLMTEELKKGITAAFALVPGIILVVGVLLMVFGYRLTREKLIQYQKEIDAREAKA